jgi:hypothetical protein
MPLPATKAAAYSVIDPVRDEGNVRAYRSGAYHPAYPAKWSRREFEEVLARLVEAWVGINEAVG